MSAPERRSGYKTPGPYRYHLIIGVGSRDTDYRWLRNKHEVKKVVDDLERSYGAHAVYRLYAVKLLKEVLL